MFAYELAKKVAEVLVFLYALRETIRGIALLIRIIRLRRGRLSFPCAVWLVVVMFILPGPSLYYGLPVWIELQGFIIGQLTA